jgi:aminoglycoside phosphotransferase (APT) family kinase protein
MDPQTLLQKMNNRPPELLPNAKLLVREVQENVFQVRAGHDLFLVKWIEDQNMRGQNELRIGRQFSRFQVIPAPRLMFEIPSVGGVIAGWEWIDGTDLRSEGRDNLIEAFTRLGELHRVLRNTGEVSVPIHGRKYAGIREMLDGELKLLCAPFDPSTTERCARILARLEVGYPTLIHGDMHPGNIIATQKRIWFVDWSYACNSLNLFDLDYIYSYPIPGDGPPWSQITPQEAVLVLPAYFRAAGLENVNYFATHLAVMVWSLLINYENSVKNGYRAELPIIRSQLEGILANE